VPETAESGPVPRRIALGVTGSVAALRAPLLASLLRAEGFAVGVICTDAAEAFFNAEEIPPGASQHERVYRDADEWPSGRHFQLGEPVLHIELRRWAELLIVAPLDAQTLAKLALGLCDNLLTCVYRAWEPDRPILLAPAMNTRMWEHPATRRHLAQLLADHGGAREPPGVDADALCQAINDTCPRLRIAVPQVKQLACGDEGMGGMASLETIAAQARSLLA
jgi:phosphopantothenoylcysteine decarboxylase